MFGGPWVSTLITMGVPSFYINVEFLEVVHPSVKGLEQALAVKQMSQNTGFYRTQYPASYTHKSLGRTRQFTLPASAWTQMCLLCLSLKFQSYIVILRVFPYLGQKKKNRCVYGLPTNPVL